ncbi:hypothetical protein AAG570_006153 [Ranatra chinensis]|uniref:Myosin tail domain-containing protein n=1 Tax=Ranatra chinensis TaxID=642074 RepID=A0ABD0YFM5_9HEMI
MKIRCEKAERDKSDILLRRLATYETTTSKTTASEVLKLQQKCNELKTTVEDLRDEKKVLTLKVRETEAELEALKATDWRKQAHILSDKLTAAETLCEELMEENEDMKKEMRDMEEEMVEMQDNFREDQADEYSSMKKELEQTTKNCRILSFKLRKAERKAEQLEAEKMEAERKLREIAGGQTGLDKAERIRQLEHELSAASRLQKDLEDATKKQKNDSQDVVPGKKKTPMLGSLPKTPSGEVISLFIF